MEPKEAAAVEPVLGNDDLLAEILLRLYSPAWLVRAAAVCTRWLRCASDPAVLRRFRALHPPRVLALHVSSYLTVPVLPPRKLAAACLQAILILARSTVLDIRNGRLLVELPNRDPAECPIYSVRSLLLLPRDWPIPSPHRMHSISLHCSCQSRLLLLLEEGGDRDEDDASCLCLDLNHSSEVFGAEYSILRSGVWSAPRPRSLVTELRQSLMDTIVAQKLLVGTKFYVMTTLGCILGLDLATASFFSVQLPDEARSSRNAKFSGGLQRSQLYLVDAKELQLCTWHGEVAGQLVLVDTICVRQACAPVKVVILELVASGIVCCMQISNRVVQKMTTESLEMYTGIVRPVCFPLLRRNIVSSRRPLAE